MKPSRPVRSVRNAAKLSNPPCSSACTSSGIDAPISSSRNDEQLEALGRGRIAGVVEPGRDEIVDVFAHENCSGASTRVPVSAPAPPSPATTSAAPRATSRRPARSTTTTGSSAGRAPSSRAARPTAAPGRRRASAPRTNTVRRAAARRARRSTGRATRCESRAPARSARGFLHQRGARLAEHAAPARPLGRAPGRASGGAPTSRSRRRRSPTPRARRTRRPTAARAGGRRAPRRPPTAAAPAARYACRDRGSIPGPDHGVGVGERGHVDIGAARERDPHLRAVRNREHEAVVVLDRARTRAPTTSTDCPVDPHATVVDDEPDRDRLGRVVLDLDHDDARVAVADRVHALDRVAAGDAQRGVHDGRGMRPRLAHRTRSVGARHQPVVPAADAPADRERTLVHGAVGVDLGRDPGRQRADADHRATRHRIPWSSGFALRSISSGTRSAGRAPS